jgi:hypothetical protein
VVHQASLNAGIDKWGAGQKLPFLYSTTWIIWDNAE